VPDTAGDAPEAARPEEREITLRERDQAQEVSERDREATRRRIAYILIGTLVIVILASFVYIIWGTLRASELTLDALTSMIQTIGTTLLAPLVGLIGAVVGFYYGGQTAVQGAQTATQASSQATQAAQSVLASQVTSGQPQATGQQRDDVS
jgi:CHASE3 domain sensor protein